MYKSKWWEWKMRKKKRTNEKHPKRLDAARNVIQLILARIESRAPCDSVCSRIDCCCRRCYLHIHANVICAVIRLSPVRSRMCLLIVFNLYLFHVCDGDGDARARGQCKSAYFRMNELNGIAWRWIEWWPYAPSSRCFLSLSPNLSL